jgi:hypothetical protein
MRASTTLGYTKVVRCVKETLETLGYEYLRNGGSRITEFEVQSPSHFRVLIEDETRERFGFGLLRGSKGEAAVEILRTLDAQDPEGTLRANVSAFVEQLRTKFPQDPWKGFGMLRSRAEKVKWSELAALRASE